MYQFEKSLFSDNFKNERMKQNNDSVLRLKTAVINSFALFQ